MLNKKILAASIAAAVTMSANAAVDLTNGTTALKYGSETIVNGGTIASAAALNFTVPVGLNLPTIAVNSEMFIRIELDNAKFATNAVEAGDLTISTAGTKAITKVGGGALTESYVVFGYSNTDTTTKSTDVLTFAFDNGTATGLTVTDKSKPVTVTYKLYENSASLAALNGGAGAVKETALAAYTFTTGQDIAKTFAGVENTALVAKQFKEFKATANVAAGKKAALGTVDLTVVTGVLAADDSAQVAEADVFTTPTTTASITGDFGFGKTWWLSALNTCGTAAAAGNTLTIAADKASATAPSLAFTAGQTLCVEVSGSEVIPRNSTGYKVSLASNTGVEGTIGSIVYDTTAVTIPYLTTFADYNQRVYILNNGSVPAPYTTTFQMEDGVTATAGAMATGTVPAKTMVAIKASDLVTFTGKTRGAAVIEIEASSSNIKATTQTVNLGDGSTDTLTLSVTGTN
ncbi:hypothetical protein [Bowmanella denitrificans]|uniref:hypothetical protein n=1 Tax=Bowmanella denitrificans TaxID=366582 RepID=UPI000C9C228C|nr:hypothetical protein [Bowmanella denitrificans]